MQPSISQNERFKEDCKKYRAAIESTNNPHVKNEMTTLLTKLISEANRIDQFYSEMTTGMGLTTHIEESRGSLSSIRKELERHYTSLKS